MTKDNEILQSQLISEPQVEEEKEKFKNFAAEHISPVASNQ